MRLIGLNTPLVGELPKSGNSIEKVGTMLIEANGRNAALQVIKGMPVKTDMPAGKGISPTTGEVWESCQITRNRITQAIWVAMGEGRNGVHFRNFATNDSNAGSLVLSDAVDRYLANHQNFGTYGQFAHEYMETVNDLVSAHVRYEVREMVHFDAIWRTWYEFLLRFTNAQ